MNSSDIINAVGLSPGQFGTINGTGTTTYTAPCNMEVRVYTAFNVSTSSTLTLNGIVLQSSSSGINQLEIGPLYFSKGQTLTFISNNVGITGLLFARSIP